MYFILGFFIALGVFFSMKADHQERVAQENARAYAEVKTAQGAYEIQQASYRTAYAAFDELMEKNDVLNFPRDFRGAWIPAQRGVSRYFFEFDSNGVLTKYRAPNGSQCFRADTRTYEMIRYSENHYVATNQPTFNRFIITGDSDSLNMSTVNRNLKSTPEKFIRIDYNDNDKYNKC